MPPAGKIGGGAVASPPFLVSCSGPVLVCGSADGLLDDFARARDLFPSAPVIAVNGAAQFVPADHLYSQHPLKLPRWASFQTEMGRAPLLHAAGRSHLRTKLGVIPPMPYVDHWWEGVASKGTSGWGARRLAAAMGFALAVLCGMPMDTRRYADGTVGKINSKPHAMEHYRSQILADAGMHEGVRSMSGWTRDLFGTPDEDSTPSLTP